MTVLCCALLLEVVCAKHKIELPVFMNSKTTLSTLCFSKHQNYIVMFPLFEETIFVQFQWNLKCCDDDS